MIQRGMSAIIIIIIIIFLNKIPVCNSQKCMKKAIVSLPGTKKKKVLFFTVSNLKS